MYTGAGRGLAERQHRPPSAAAPGVGMVEMQLLLPGLRRNCNSDAPSFNSVSHKTSFSKKYMFEHIEDIGPAVRPTLIISFGQMNRGEIAAGWDW